MTELMELYFVTEFKFPTACNPRLADWKFTNEYEFEKRDNTLHSPDSNSDGSWFNLDWHLGKIIS